MTTCTRKATQASSLMPIRSTDRACKLTLNGNIAGCLDFGANAQSGWGDGCYECFVKCNEHGVAVAARIVFINEDE